jgi:ribosome-binding factor A
MAKPMRKRATRVADQIRMEVADIIMRKTKDPRVADVTVTDVEVTNDLRRAWVFVTALGDEGAQDGALAGLTNAAGFIRMELGRRLQLRYTPELVFRRDLSGARGARIRSLLDQVGAGDASGASHDQ